VCLPVSTCDTQVAGAALDIVYGQQVARGFGSIDQHATWRAKALQATPPCRFEHFQVTGGALDLVMCVSLYSITTRAFV
jgi:hypothetical protein